MLSSVVLAGGTGSRMGGDKGLVEFRSRPMVLHVVDVVTRLGGDLVVAVGKRGEALYRRHLGESVTIVEDRETGRGPLEGLCRAFDAAKGDLVAVAPCDALFLKEEVLRLLAESADGADGAVPVVRGFLEPLVAVYRKDVGLRAFETGLTSGSGKVGDAIARMDLRAVGEEDLKAVDTELMSFWNVNSLEDLRRAESLTHNPYGTQ